MTSKASQTECFVYITPPRQTKSVTAGRFVMIKDKLGNAGGRFIYGRSYLARTDAVEIDPIELRLHEGTYSSTRLGGIFSSLRDSGPDFWGRRLIERHLAKTGLSEIDYLLNSPDDRAGALGFGLNRTPPAPLKKFNKTIKLEQLQQVADKLVREQLDEPDQDSVQIQELLLVGTSMGGARPKAVVEDAAGLWVAKFGRPDDRWNNTRVEHAMLELARSCGISAARSRIESVAGRDILLVQRFDRDKTAGGYSRARMISALTMLRAEESAMHRERWSYVLLAEELRRVVRDPKGDAAELFRRMCFNALIANTDDHPRNHAFIAFDRHWDLSPAYDLTPSPSVSHQRDLALACGDNGRVATAQNLLSQHARFLLDKQQASEIISRMTEQVRSTWYSLLRAHGVTERDAETIKTAFVYPGWGS